MQTLQDKSGSGVVTIPRGDLDRDDILVDGDVPDEQCVDVERLGRRAYVVRFPENGQLPELAESPLLQRIAAQVQFVPRTQVQDEASGD